MVETATTGNLEQAQNTIIREARYTQEANSPSWQLIDKVRLPKGASTVRVPKVGQFTIADLVDGTTISTEQSINMSLVDLTATERGAKIVITDKLARQNGTTDVFRMIGRQFGDAAARKQDQDVQALLAVSPSARRTLVPARSLRVVIASRLATIANRRARGRGQIPAPRGF